MEIYVLDSRNDYTPVGVIDSYTSLIWTKRYYNYGDFELYLPASDNLLDILRPDFFLTRDDDDSVMVIEKIQIQTDAENGDYFLVSGRSLESILLRRIFEQQFVYESTGTLADAVSAFVTECTTNHDASHAHPYTYRQIAGLTVDTSSSFDGTMQIQFTGDTLLSAIIAVCKQREIGFKLTLQDSTMLLSLYQGNDVSDNVIFSTEFDNLVSSKYLYDTTNLANSIAVFGEGEGDQRKKYYRLFFNRDVNPESGLDLRELYVDARNISSNNGEIDNNAYFAMLAQKADEVHANHDISQSFESEIEPRMTFDYKKDYNLGDIVTVQNDYGITAKPRIIEIIENWSDEGYKVIPTFDVLEVVPT